MCSRQPDLEAPTAEKSPSPARYPAIPQRGCDITVIRAGSGTFGLAHALLRYSMCVALLRSPDTEI